MSHPDRRAFLRLGGLALAGLGLGPIRPLAGGRRLGLAGPTAALEVIEMGGDTLGTKVWFDPIGLHVTPGTTVRWIVRQNVHTATAYSPANAHHPLRIPDGATPWDSGFLVNPGDHFDVTLTVPGVYDYYCMPHEMAGMVGRIVVGASPKATARPFDYWVGRPGTADWSHVPEAARTAFPPVAQILAEGRVHPTTTGR